MTPLLGVVLTNWCSLHQKDAKGWGLRRGAT
jgi:hypothetical protein